MKLAEEVLRPKSPRPGFELTTSASRESLDQQHEKRLTTITMSGHPAGAPQTSTVRSP